MTIKGYGDRGMAFPVIGQIRKGAPKEENRPGRDLPYFRVTFTEGEDEAAALFASLYKDKPDTLKVILPTNDLTKVWSYNLEGYVRGRMVARSNGEYYSYLVDNLTGAVVVAMRDGEEPPRDAAGNLLYPYKKDEPATYYINKKGEKVGVIAKPVGRLHVMLPELARMVYLTMLTGSWHDIENINAQLNSLDAITRGNICGVPLMLKRRPQMLSTPKSDSSTGQAMRIKRWMVSIEAHPDWVEAKLRLLANAQNIDASLLIPGSVALPTYARLEGANKPENTLLGMDKSEADKRNDEDWVDVDIDPNAPISQEGESAQKADPVLDANIEKIIDGMLAGETFWNEQHEKVTDKQRGFSYVLLKYPFGEGGDKVVNEIIRFVYNQTNIYNLSDGAVKSIIEWAKPINSTEAKGFIPSNPDMISDLKILWRFIQVSKGQLELSLEDGAA